MFTSISNLERYPKRTIFQFNWKLMHITKLPAFSLVSILSNCQACLLCIRTTFFSFRSRTIITRLQTWTAECNSKGIAQIFWNIRKMHKFGREFSNFRWKSLLFRQSGAAVLYFSNTDRKRTVIKFYFRLIRILSKSIKSVSKVLL